MIPEVEYFVKWRRIAASNNVDTTTGPCVVLRPTIYTPNYSFYVPDLVCHEHAMPRIEWRPQYNRFTVEDAQQVGMAYCKLCEKLDPVSFKKCPTCGGAFYDLFRHGFQTDRNHHCWTCLENGSNREKNWLYGRFTNLAPPDHLIPPPVTDESKADADKAFWENIAAILG